MAEKIMVEGDITLGQFLKIEGIIESGGQAKWFLNEFEVLLNGERETRRGKKLLDGDRIDFPDIEEIGSFVIVHQGDQ